MNKSDDLMLMAQQSMCYDILKQFLKSDLAIEGKLTGFEIKVENGYVNAEWHFGERTKGDIKDEL